MVILFSHSLAPSSLVESVEKTAGVVLLAVHQRLLAVEKQPRITVLVEERLRETVVC